MIDTDSLNRLSERQKIILHRRSQGIKDRVVMREVGLNKNAYYDEVSAAYTVLGIDPYLDTRRRTREFDEKFGDEFRRMDEADLMGVAQSSKAKVGQSEVKEKRETNKSRRWLLPSIVGVVALILVTLLFSRLLGGTTASPGSEGRDLTNLGVGDEITNGRVAIELENSGFNYLAHFGVNAYRVAIGFVFRFHNNTTEEILFRYNEDSVTLVDNLGREYDCKLKRGDSQPETINTSVPMMERIRFEVICGRGLNFDLDVEWVKLSLKDLSTLPDTTWHIDVPR